MNGKAREFFANLIRTAHRCKIGSTLYLGSEEEIRKVRDNALRRGKVVEDELGLQMWFDTVAVTKPNVAGSARYEWHNDGNRVRAEKFLVLKKGDKIVDRISQGKCWIKWEEA